MMKRLSLALALLLAFSMLFGCAAKSTPEKTEDSPSQTPVAQSNTAEEYVPFTFVDSVGREVKFDAPPAKIAVSGPLAQIFCFALCPDLLIGIATEWDASANDLIDQKYLELPVLGQLYGGKGELNLEELLKASPDVVIDIGEPKDGIVEDLDALEEQTGIRFVHITTTLETADDAYRLLGDLVGMPIEAETLAEYCDDTLEYMTKLASNVDRVSFVYCVGAEGLNIIAKGSYHAGLFDLLTDNAAVVSEPSSKGTGNETDLEQLLLWNPDVIVFEPNGAYDAVSGDSAWQQLSAIKNGNYYEAPFALYNWLGFPPSVQRYLGMWWLAKLLYPDAADYDLKNKVFEYFELFYHCNPTDEQYNEMIKSSLSD